MATGTYVIATFSITLVLSSVLTPLFLGSWPKERGPTNGAVGDVGLTLATFCYTPLAFRQQ
uniref:Uncharacterized protein n=1 Tax=Moniliophthora roreri TaxID=221103 RepID=A0A0W0FNK8_MONRR